MSRLAKKPIQIPQNVKVTLDNNKIIVEGKLGKVVQEFKPEYVNVKLENNSIIVEKKENMGDSKVYQGLYWSLFRNMVDGVLKGYSKTLIIQGLGYKWELKGKDLYVQAGYSNPVIYRIPDNITVTFENPQTLKIFGCDKHLVGQVAADIRSIRKPEPYKGKGIRYADEVIKLKEGKSAK